ncbi:MAG TPA: ABC transporter permease [Dongiaceae bacterium]|jgi:ABC-2 type transport system permease protein|nr:ABC transporter permease [Dongiaceae bacterium]
MHRIWAIIERDLRRFRRSPVLVVVSIIMPLVQLLVLGYAFGGKVKHLQLGVVNEDQSVPAVKLQEMFQAVAANAKTFTPIPYTDKGAALRDLRNGKIGGVLDIPPQFARKILAGANPRIALIEDNTDQFSASAMEGALNGMLPVYNGPPVRARRTADVSLSVVEIYPYVPYIQYLLPGTIVLAIFVSAMIGGGIIFIDDKARGLHEGYLVTPIRKLELILGFTFSGAAKAIIAGVVLITVGSVLAGIPDPFNPLRLARMFLLVVATSLALISMMFLIMVRVSDPLVPRAIFGMLNTVLFFPSGAVYPTQAFPPWMKAITVVDPFTYAVHGFKNLVLKNTGLAAIGPDLLFLVVFTLLAMTAATLLFRRTL